MASRRSGHRQPADDSLLSLLAERASRGQKILAFLIAAGVIGSGLAFFERTYGPVGTTMGWLRLVDMTAHESKHSLEVKAAVKPVESKVDEVKGSIDEIREERIYFNYKQTSWEIQTLESKLAKEHTLTQQDYAKLTDLRTENARLKKWLDSRPMKP